MDSQQRVHCSALWRDQYKAGQRHNRGVGQSETGSARTLPLRELATQPIPHSNRNGLGSWSRVAIYLNSHVPKPKSLENGQLESDGCSIQMAWQMILRRLAPASVKFNLTAR